MAGRRYTDLAALFKEELPFDFWVALITGMPAVYKAAWSHVLNHFGGARVWDLLPHIRRALVEEHLEKTANQFRDLSGRAELNIARNCHHVEVRSQSIVLTANAVNTPKEMVRDARFRATLAQRNYPLFPDMQEPLEGDYYFAMILHGPDPYDVSKVAFVELGFPSRDGKAYVGGPYNLISYCAVNLYEETPEEMVEDKAEPRLRLKTQVQGG